MANNLDLEMRAAINASRETEFTNITARENKKHIELIDNNIIFACSSLKEGSTFVNHFDKINKAIKVIIPESTNKLAIFVDPIIDESIDHNFFIEAKLKENKYEIIGQKTLSLIQYLSMRLQNKELKELEKKQVKGIVFTECNNLLDTFLEKKFTEYNFVNDIGYIDSKKLNDLIYILIENLQIIYNSIQDNGFIINFYNNHKDYEVTELINVENAIAPTQYRSFIIHLAFANLFNMYFKPYIDNEGDIIKGIYIKNINILQNKNSNDLISEFHKKIFDIKSEIFKFIIKIVTGGYTINDTCLYSNQRNEILDISRDKKQFDEENIKLLLFNYIHRQYFNGKLLYRGIYKVITPSEIIICLIINEILPDEFIFGDDINKKMFKFTNYIIIKMEMMNYRFTGKMIKILESEKLRPPSAKPPSQPPSSRPASAKQLPPSAEQLPPSAEPRQPSRKPRPPSAEPQSPSQPPSSRPASAKQLPALLESKSPSAEAQLKPQTPSNNPSLSKTNSRPISVFKRASRIKNSKTTKLRSSGSLSQRLTNSPLAYSKLPLPPISRTKKLPSVGEMYPSSIVNNSIFLNKNPNSKASQSSNRVNIPQIVTGKRPPPYPFRLSSNNSKKKTSSEA